MDRLPLVGLGAAAALSLLVGCGSDDGASPPPPSRVVAVQAEAVDPAEELCDVVPEARPRLALPALAEGSRAPTASGRRWLNVWATWCAPCVEEMPMLDRWRDCLADDGVDVALVFLSADGDDDAVTAYRAEHALPAQSARIADPAALPAWATTVGLDEGATLPIHVFTDAGGRVVCARTGAVDEDDYAAVAAILDPGD